MVAVVILILTCVGGWLGWSLWLSIPFGYAMFAAAFWGRREEALKHAHSAWLAAPLTALAIMWLSRWIHALISN